MGSLLPQITATATTLFASIYGAGFLVVTFRLGEFGISDFNLLRPHIFLAGALFLLLTAIPVFVALKICGVVPSYSLPPPGAKPVLREGLFRFTVVPFFYVMAVGLAASSAAVFLAAPSWILNAHWLVLVSPLILLAFVLAFLERYFFDRYWYLFVPASIVNSGIMFWVLLHHADNSFFWLTNWYYIAGIATFWFYMEWRSESFKGKVGWEFLPVYLLSLTLLYSSKVYPVLRPQLGGGAPSQVVLYLSASTPVFNSGSASVLLVEETDKGYYIFLKADDKEGYFIRRDFVTAIKFEGPKKNP